MPCYWHGAAWFGVNPPPPCHCGQNESTKPTPSHVIGDPRNPDFWRPEKWKEFDRPPAPGRGSEVM